MADIAFEKDLAVAETGIGGLKVVDLAVHGDSRGWFKENWQRAKMTALGIPDLRVVQNNISYNDSRGVTRGIHAEPWDKFISVARGSVFGAWVDLREGSETFGKVYTTVLDPSKAIYVPRGVGNSFQALEDGTAYTYLVDAHWSLELKKTYTFVNLADPELAIEWPIPLDEATVSEADLNHPYLKDVVPMAPKRTLVTGCDGQLGHAVRALAEERGEGLRLLRHRHLRHVRPGGLFAVRLVALRHRHQLRRLHGGRQGGDPRGPRDRLEGQRDRSRPSRPHLRRARHHARPRVLRLRLRRHRGGA